MTGSDGNLSPQGRRLVLCLDGTWNTAQPLPGVDLTNCARLAAAVLPADAQGRAQLLLYQEGVGTAGVLDRSVYGFTGKGIDGKIRQAYAFLAENWRPGDEIWLFGVSRGAFVALAISRLVGRYGLPAAPGAGAWDAVWPAWLEDQDLPPLGWARPAVDFLGAWDTVEALGLQAPGFRRPTSPNVGPRGSMLGSTVARAFHALAFHEKRGPYRPTIWQGPFPAGARVEQRWFRGTHADVCGGFGNPALADVSLSWMLARAGEAGLAVDPALERGLRPEPFARLKFVHTGWHRLLPTAKRHPGQTSPESETMDEALLVELAGRIEPS